MVMIKKEEADRILKERAGCEPGKWVRHSENVALAAGILAGRMRLDQEKAYCYGLLHDIGRSFTKGQFRHISCGYEYMHACGYEDAAGICLSHSFAVQDIYSYVGKIDICEKEQWKYQTLLQARTYDDYDRLIQLCDAVATDQGFVLPEQRFVELSFRYGFNDFTIRKWRTILQIKKEISMKAGENVNELLAAYHTGAECL